MKKITSMSAMSGRMKALIVLGAAVLSASCSTDPPTQFHSLLMPPGAVDMSSAEARNATTMAQPILYDMGPLVIPQQVNQPQFVIRNPDNSLTMLEQQRWVAPLADELKSSLSERLGRQYKLQLARHSTPGERATERLSVDVLRFEAIPGQEVRIEASWSVRTLSEPATGLSCHSEIRQSVGPGYEAITAGFRASVALLADDIGPVMRSLRNGATVCR